MKKLWRVGICLFVLAAIGWGIGLAADEATDSGSATITLDQLGLVGTNMMSLGSLTDPQLEAFLNILNATPTKSEPELPKSGTFWSLGHYGEPPFPTDISGAAAWSLPDGSFLLDDKTVKANVLTKGSKGAKAFMGAGEFVAAVSGPPSLSDTNSTGTNFEAADVNFLNYIPYGTNLYIAHCAVANGYLTAIASNTIPSVVYTIQEETYLIPTNWQNVGTFVGSASTNWTQWSTPQGSGSNLFIRLRSEISTDGSGIPDWWEQLYFGTNVVNPNAQDSAGDGYTIYQKYALGVAPGTWLRPPAPSAFSVFYNYNKGTVALSWNLAQGAVYSYKVFRWNPTYGSFATYTLSSNATSMVDNAPIINFPPEHGEPLYFLAAVYTNGSASSTNSQSMFDSSTTVSGQIYANWQNQEQLLVQGSLPAGTTTLLLTCSDYNSGYSETKHSLPVSALTNNSTYLSGSWFNSSGMTDGNEDWYIQTINADGGVSSMTEADSLDWTGGNQTYPSLFIDGRQQMVQNEMFQFRAASASQDFQYSYSGNAIYYSTYPSSGLYDVTMISVAQESFDNSPSSLSTFDPYRPFIENYFLHNFAFSTNDIDPTTGNLTTGISFDWVGPLLAPLVQEFPTYQYIPNSNTLISAILSPAQTQWTCFDPQTQGLASFGGGSVGDYGISGAGGNYALGTTVSNSFGLQYLSARFTYVTNGVLEMPILNAGRNISDVMGGWLFSQTAVPQLKTAGYYFAQPQSDWALPGEYGFSINDLAVTNALVAGYGQENLFAGYAERELLNGYPGCFSFLGQYFANAYQINANGYITTTNAGTISPYGVLVPTVVGPVALVTMTNWGENVQGTATVQVVKLVLDVNHDGVMDLSFTGPDNTSPSSPYVFWCNNNFDRWATTYSLLPSILSSSFSYTDTEQDDQQVGFCPAAPGTITPDCEYMAINQNDASAMRVIPCTRDLEDFSRLWVCGMTTNLLNALPAGSTVTLSWGDVNNPDTNNPTIDLFMAADADGGVGYQTNEVVATLQTNAVQCPYVGRISPGQSIPLSSFDTNNNPTWLGNHFIWCGVSNGTGGLTMTIADADNNVLAKTITYIQIKDIKQMYERWTVGDNETLMPTTTPRLATDYPTNSMSETFEYANLVTTNTPYILFVHGYNLPVWKKNWFAEVEFKRLYWQGYQGRFGSLRWPTTEQTRTYLHAFDDSELHAWSSAAGLLSLLTKLDKIYGAENVYLTAHSHGNIVVSEALRQATQQGLGQVANTYIAMQAALDSHTYDPTTATRSTVFTTPDRYAQYYTNGAPSYFNGVAGAGTYVNFYNTNDWALNITWPYDENNKPDTGIGYGYELNQFGDEWLKFGETFTFPTNTYTIFSYIDQAHANAIGMQANTGGAFLKNPIYNQISLPSVWPPDNGTPPYSAHVWHSAEFRSDYAQRWQCWNAVLKQMKLK